MIVKIRRWWHARRYRMWEGIWLEATGKMVVIMEGERGFLYRIAFLDRVRAENMMRYHAPKAGLPHAVDAPAAAPDSGEKNG